MAEGNKHQWRSSRIPSLAESVAIIYEFEKIRSGVKLARAYGCSTAHVQYILRRKEEYLREWKNNKDFKELRNEYTPTFGSELLGAVVNEWVLRSRGYGLPSSDDQIFQIGLGVAKLLNIKDFRPTCFWLQRIKNKYNLDNLGPLPAPQPVGLRWSLNLVDILTDFKTLGPPKEVPPFLLSHIDINTKTGRIRNKRKRNGSSVNFIPIEPSLTTVMSVGNNTKLTIDKTIPTIEIDDDDDDVNPLENQLTSEDNTSLNTIVTIPENQQISPMEAQQLRMEESKEESLSIISSYKEALDYLKPLEQFLLMKENVRAIGTLNELEDIYKENEQTISLYCHQ